MFRQNKAKIFLSFALILLPIPIGLLLWDRLPGQIPIHWSAGGADNWASRAFTVFALPLIFAAAYVLCLFFTLRDPKNKNQSGKALGLVFWLLPLTSLLASGMMYASSFGMVFGVLRLMPLVTGLLFAAIGNYLPKCRQNQTLGIRVKWALENEENWNATHRFGGRLWVVCGLAAAACAFLPQRFLISGQLIPLLLISFLPILYSYLYYCRQIKNGELQKPAPTPLTPKKALNIAAPILIILLVGASLFIGDIQYEYGADSFTIHAFFWPDSTINYAEIGHLEYRPEDMRGTRSNGYGSAQLLMGTFVNDEFGFYTRYSYTRCPSCVVLEIGGQTLVLSGKDDAETKALYEELLSRYAPT